MSAKKKLFLFFQATGQAMAMWGIAFRDTVIPISVRAARESVVRQAWWRRGSCVNFVC
jgi:hypothetical protein